ncbi:MAG: 2-iminoacetate synthase ThiH [Deltaproteobacteria bacterium]|nr:2-iminoacetate synthase ThiH [Deltaproteobacteria bacterium]
MTEFTLPEFGDLREMAASCGSADVEQALRLPSLEIRNLAALISPAAEAYLPEMARRSAAITRQRFGRKIQIYAPIYVSNYCVNRCAYCGFSTGNKIKRRLLSIDEAAAEAEILKKRGFCHILLVAGEAPEKAGVDYFAELSLRLRDRFAAISIEIQPLEEDEYARLFAAGISSVAVYQETYDRALYPAMHLAGRKSDYDFRLATPARAAAAGMREVGIGALLGLSDWRGEGLALGMHLAWLRKNFWRTALTVSFPRLQPAAGGFKALQPVSEKAMTQLIFALRLFDPDVGLLVSTREEARYRDGMVGLGPTRYSAGSCTAPGGYSEAPEATEQFEVDDHRSITEVCEAIKSRGFDPVKKDWDAAFQMTDVS